MCKISRQSEYVFVFYSNFLQVCENTKKEKNEEEKKTETLTARISETAGAISFQFGI